METNINCQALLKNYCTSALFKLFKWYYGEFNMHQDFISNWKIREEVPKFCPFVLQKLLNANCSFFNNRAVSGDSKKAFRPLQAMSTLPSPQIVKTNNGHPQRNPYNIISE